MRVLLVEDDEVLRDGIVAGLGLDGFEVDAVSTLAEAREGAASGDHAMSVRHPLGGGRRSPTSQRRNASMKSSSSFAISSGAATIRCSKGSR